MLRRGVEQRRCFVNVAGSEIEEKEQNDAMRQGVGHEGIEKARENVIREGENLRKIENALEREREREREREERYPTLY